MNEQRYEHNISLERLVQLLLYQANQFELFKNFVIEMLDSRDIIPRREFQTFFEEYKQMNKSKLLHNLIMMNPTLEDMKIDLTICE